MDVQSAATAVVIAGGLLAIFAQVAQWTGLASIRRWLTILDELAGRPDTGDPALIAEVAAARSAAERRLALVLARDAIRVPWQWWFLRGVAVTVCVADAFVLAASVSGGSRRNLGAIAIFSVAWAGSMLVLRGINLKRARRHIAELGAGEYTKTWLDMPVRIPKAPRTLIRKCRPKRRE